MEGRGEERRENLTSASIRALGASGSGRNGGLAT